MFDKFLEFLPRILIPDEAMFLLSFVLFCVLLWYSCKREDYVIGAISIAMIFRMVYFGLLTFDIEPFNSSTTIRAATTRPSEAAIIILLCVFFVNGRVNRFIEKTLRRLSFNRRG